MSVAIVDLAALVDGGALTLTVLMRTAAVRECADRDGRLRRARTRIRGLRGWRGSELVSCSAYVRRSDVPGPDASAGPCEGAAGGAGRLRRIGTGPSRDGLATASQARPVTQRPVYHAYATRCAGATAGRHRSERVGIAAAVATVDHNRTFGRAVVRHIANERAVGDMSVMLPDDRIGRSRRVAAALSRRAWLA